MIDSVEAVDDDYTKRAPQWQRCRDAFEGSDAVKAKPAKYLTRMESHNDSEFADYVARASFLPATEKTLTVLSGLAFRKDITIKLPTRRERDVRRHLKDITLDGADLPQIAALALRETLLVGRFGILQAWSPGLDRPFWVDYRTEDILRRTFTRLPTGLSVLDGVLLREFRRERFTNGKRLDREYRIAHELVPVPGTDRYAYRIQPYRLRLDEHGNEKPGANGERFEIFGPAVFPQRNGEAMDRVPFSIFTSHANPREIPKPPMLDMVDINFSHYRSSADLEYGAAWTARPTPWITGHAATQERLTVGGNKAWVLPSPDAKVGMLEYNGNGLSTIAEMMTAKERHMAALGAKMFEVNKRAAESAESLRLRAAESGASLNDAVSACSKTLTMALWVYLWWLLGDAEPDDEEVDVAISRDYVDVQIDPNLLNSLLALVQAGKMSYETFYYNLQKGELTRPGITFEEEQNAADAEFTDDAEPEVDTTTPDPDAIDDDGVGRDRPVV